MITIPELSHKNQTMFGYYHAFGELSSAKTKEEILTAPRTYFRAP
jgi:hypothetical protein